jgi:hypothetical protein
MARVAKSFVEDFIDGLRQHTTCDWCRHPWEPISRAGLCSHCYNIRRKLLALTKLIKDQGSSIEREIDYKIALRKSQLARAEGLHYGNLHKRTISALDLEHELTDLAKKLVNKRIFYGDATSIGWALPFDQRMYVFYLLSLVQRQYLRQNRHQMAQRETEGMSLAEVEALDNP